MSEAKCSTVIPTRSNAVSGSAEPLLKWRRQYPQSKESAPIAGLPGVTGKTCGEIRSQKDGRSDNVPNVQMHQNIKRPIAGFDVTVRNEVKVKDAISVTREGHPDALSEIRGADSSDEMPATGTDAKRPQFDGGSEVARGSSSHEWCST